MTINCKGKLIDLTETKVMGILNITPDSFYDGGMYKSDKEILSKTEQMLKEGASFIDIGAYSSRPGATHITEDEELLRITPIVKLLIEYFPDIIMSIDTFRSKVAKETINIGAALINDISGGEIDNNMFKTISKIQVPYILTHMLGTPQNMQKNPKYDNITKELISFFAKKILELRKLQIKDIIIDVGFGFGKTIDHNYTLLKDLKLFEHLNTPNLVGISRKSMLYKFLGVKTQEALNATSVANTIAVINGAKILRVHDVKEAMETIKIVNKTYSNT